MPTLKKPTATILCAPKGRSTVPAHFAMDDVLWAAWLYYEQGLKQDEIARKLRISRASVFNLLQKARDDGVVTIAIDPARAAQIEMAQELCDRTTLKECYVLPNLGTEANITEQIGHLGARVIEARLQDDDTIGVAWGQTVLNLSRALNPARFPGITVAQTTGSSAATFDFSPVMCTSNIAAKLQARAVNLHAPGVVSSPHVKDILMVEPEVRAHFDLLQRCTKLLFGVTQLEGPTLLVQAGFMTGKEVQDYIDLGGVGFASGHFFDSGGNIIRTGFDDRHITLAVENLRKVPERLCLSGGEQKVDAIMGMLRAELANILIVDAATARSLLERL